MNLTFLSAGGIGASLGFLRRAPAVPVAASLAYWTITALMLRNRFTGDSAARGSSRVDTTSGVASDASAQLGNVPPALFFRPVKRGVPGLRDKATRLIRAARPGDAVLFGVECEADAADCEAACLDAARGVVARVVRCEPSRAPNPKIGKLIQLAAYAGTELDPGRDHWIVTDSEALLEPDFMDAFRLEWRDSGAAALTAGYRFVGAFAGVKGWPQRLDHLPALLTLWPGLVVTEWGTRRAATTGGLGGCVGLGFTLGACTGVRRSDLEIVGGWAALATYLAEDNKLGRLLGEAGFPVRLSQGILTLDADPAAASGRAGLRDWVDWLRHQHRVTVTYRVCNPGGTFGMIFTHGLSWALLLALLNANSLAAWIILSLAFGVRIGTARRNAELLQFPIEKRWGEFPLLVTLASLAETAFWLVCWFPLPVRWGAASFHVGSDGEIEA